MSAASDVDRGALPDTRRCQHGLHGLLDRLLSVEAQGPICHALDWKQRSRDELRPSSEIEQHFRQICRLCHYAASGRPSDSAAWITVPCTLPQARASSSLTSTTSANTSRSSSAHRSR